MVTINYAFREISCKIVYYGPGLSGKTTNLQYVHDRVPAKSRGDLISLATETDRTLYFDFLPIHVGDIAGFATKFQLYTVPGQVFYNATRKLVLRGVDGIVFVADSQAAKMDENIESLSNMYENLSDNRIDINDIPVVMQYNKRDLPDVSSVEELEKTLNPEGRPFVEASAVHGSGVFDTLKRITKLVLEHTKKRTAVASPADTEGPPEPAAEPVGVSVAQQSVPAVGGSGGIPKTELGAVRRTRTDRSVAVADGAPAARPRVDTTNRDGLPHDAPSPHSERLLPGRVLAPQQSLRIRRKHRSLWSRLFGWLFGR